MFELLNSSPDSTVEERQAENLLRDVLSEVDAKLAIAGEALAPLIKATHELFEVHPFDPETRQGSYLVNGPDASADTENSLLPEQRLYPETSYNDAFYRNDLDKRNWGAVDYFMASHALDDEAGDSPEMKDRKAQYRQAVLTAAQALGFVPTELRQPHQGDDTLLGIVDGDLEPIRGKVDEIIVPGVAGLSNHKRLRDAIKNIESGKIDTDHIIMTACDRPASQREKEVLTNSTFTAGETEYALNQAAVHDLSEGFVFTLEERPLDVEFEGGTFTGKVLSGIAMIGDKEVAIDIVSSPFDETRVLADGKPAQRAITEETFIAALQLLKEGPGTIVVESHDTWIPCQTLVAQRIFSLQAGKKVIGTGPYNADRLAEDFEGNITLQKAGDVISELSKYVYELTKLRIAIENQIKKQAS